MLGHGWTGLAVMIGAFDEVRTGRKHLLYRTLKTAVLAFPGSIIYVVDNGSEGEDAALVERMAGQFEGVIYRNVGVPKDGNRTAGRLANERLRILAEEQQTPGGLMPSVVVLCDDDVWWYPGAERKLEAAWRGVLGAGLDIGIIGGYMEPLWHWNTPDGSCSIPSAVGGEPTSILIRPNTPGGAMSFLLGRQERGPSAWFRRWIDGSGPPVFEESMRFDTEACERVVLDGMRIGQMDLCDHTGVGMSAWGNRAIETAIPLDRSIAGMELPWHTATRR